MDIDHESGRIRVVMPANCSSTNILQVRGLVGANSTSVLRIEDVRGLQSDTLTNGSVSVIAGTSSQKILPKASGLCLVAALVVIAALARRMRYRPC